MYIAYMIHAGSAYNCLKICAIGENIQHKISPELLERDVGMREREREGGGGGVQNL